MKNWFYIAFSGIIWLSMGLYLFMKGIDFLSKSNLEPVGFFLVVIISLLTGLLKEKFILEKTVKRISKRILSFDLPISIFKIYDIKFYVVIFIMIILGQLLKLLSFSLIIRGGVDLAIAFALIRGGGSFFWLASIQKKELKNSCNNF